MVEESGEEEDRNEGKRTTESMETTKCQSYTSKKVVVAVSLY